MIEGDVPWSSKCAAEMCGRFNCRFLDASKAIKSNEIGTPVFAKDKLKLKAYKYFFYVTDNLTLKTSVNSKVVKVIDAVNRRCVNIDGQTPAR